MIQGEGLEYFLPAIRYKLNFGSKHLAYVGGYYPQPTTHTHTHCGLKQKLSVTLLTVIQTNDLQRYLHFLLIKCLDLLNILIGQLLGCTEVNVALLSGIRQLGY